MGYNITMIKQRFKQKYGLGHIRKEDSIIDKISISYCNINNEIICSTESIQLKFKLSPYYEDCQIDRVTLLEDGIISFHVKKVDYYFEDFISIEDSIYGEDGDRCVDLQSQWGDKQLNKVCKSL